MASGVKLRKIDQLIEKFFYDGLRATNSTPVRVTSRVTKHFDAKPSNILETYQRKMAKQSEDAVHKVTKDSEDILESESEPKPSTSKGVNKIINFFERLT